MEDQIKTWQHFAGKFSKLENKHLQTELDTIFRCKITRKINRKILVRPEFRTGSLLRHYATRWKVAGSIPDVIGIYN
jgi:hypothetical protein